ncbi:tail fiber domain-containing protein [Mucilaginibacter sp. PPCGB 2223]|uniref:tail fiber domain-containing protein n=1 Tax=Mucilaginibacter sp. PPCGB 2223 TaxID=1886027 RepID=UPI001586A066|nr:tail fiber domain-containing protein [Mucilaginibacter sp. PPCGB 2223]
MIHNGTVWERSGGAQGVTSVNGQQGAVSLNTDSIAQGLTHLYWSNALGDARYPVLSGSYADPSWITSLAWSKLSGTPTTIAGYGITDFNSLGDARYLGLTATAANASQWAGYTLDTTSIYSTGIDAIMARTSGTSGSRFINAGAMSAFLGLGNGAFLNASATAVDGTLVQRYGGGFVQAVYFNQSGGAVDEVALGSNLAGIDSSGYFRKFSAGSVQSWLGLGSNAYNSTPYLPLSGGTISGQLNFSGGTFPHVNGNGSSLTLSANGNWNSGATSLIQLGTSDLTFWSNGGVFHFNNASGTTIVSINSLNGRVSASGFSAGGSSAQALTADGGTLTLGSGATNDWTHLQSTTHAGTYWVQNAWDGTYWQLTSNHPSPVNVGRANVAGSAENFPISARGNTDFNTITNNSIQAGDDTAPHRPGDFVSLLTLNNGDRGLQIAGGYTNDSLFFRGWSSSGAAFTAWRSVLHDGNYLNYGDASANANTLVKRDGNGDITGHYFNAAGTPVDGSISPAAFYVSNGDAYIRKISLAQVQTALGLGSAAYASAGAFQAAENQRLSTGNNVSFAQVSSGAFIKTGGTSAQFLKADGSVDGNTYASSSALSGYLPLTGGTLSGSLTATAFYNSSDIRLKQLDARPLDFGRLDQLELIAYYWKDQRDTRLHYGYSAQMVEALYPGLVGNDSQGLKAVNYTELHSLQIAAVKNETELLKEKITLLEREVVRLGGAI